MLISTGVSAAHGCVSLSLQSQEQRNFSVNCHSTMLSCQVPAIFGKSSRQGAAPVNPAAVFVLERASFVASNTSPHDLTRDDNVQLCAAPIRTAILTVLLPGSWGS